MSLSCTSPFLRRALIADAVISGGTGLLMAAAADLLAGLLGVPAALPRFAGLSLLPFAAILLWLAMRPALPRAAVWAVIALNALWAVDSVVLLFTGWVDPTWLGYAFILAQAAVVAAFAELQLIGLHRSPAAA